MAQLDEPRQKRPRQPKQFFTVASANKTLPLVRSIAQDVIDRFNQRIELHERLKLIKNTKREAMTPAHREEVEQVEREFERTESDLRELADELRQIGVDLKGPDGLVDFPAQLQGREICLCWKFGEPEVMFWHEIEAGFAGRHPVASLPAMTLGAASATDGAPLDASASG